MYLDPRVATKKPPLLLITPLQMLGCSASTGVPMGHLTWALPSLKESEVWALVFACNGVTMVVGHIGSTLEVARRSVEARLQSQDDEKSRVCTGSIFGKLLQSDCQ